MDIATFLSSKKDCFFSLNEELSRHGLYKTGGKAQAFICPATEKTLKSVRDFCGENDIKTVVIGNGGNVLFSDKGFNGAVICTKRLKGLSLYGELLTAAAGESLYAAYSLAERNSLSGLESLSGIPATVGGAVIMNAGAFNKSISDVIDKVKVLSDGKIITVSAKDCGFSYRKSGFAERDVILSATFSLIKADRETIRKTALCCAAKRKNTQPNGRTCGSVFVNPKGYFAAELIERAGLKGYNVGGARVSVKHANFIMAERGATSGDIYALIKEIKSKIYDKYGVSLKEEIRYVGDFD